MDILENYFKISFKPRYKDVRWEETKATWKADRIDKLGHLSTSDVPKIDPPAMIWKLNLIGGFN